MSRLVTFGCSFTQGFKLSHPEKAWPYIVANELTRSEVVNRGEPGVSNLKILTNILKFEFKPKDLVIVMWTWPWREVLMHTNQEAQWSHLLVGNDSEAVTQWVKYHTEYDMLMRSWISIHHANQYLTNQKITCYNFATNADLFDYKPEFCKMNVCYPDIADIIKQYGSVDGNEGMHPNEESHKHIAHAMLNKVLGGYV